MSPHRLQPLLPFFPFTITLFGGQLRLQREGKEACGTLADPPMRGRAWRGVGETVTLGGPGSFPLSLWGKSLGGFPRPP